MKTKQVIAVIIATALFLVTGITGAVSAVISSKAQENMIDSFKGEFDSLFYPKSNGIDLPDSEYIGQIDIVDTIQGSTGAASYFSTPNTYNHDLYMEFIDKMMEDENNKGIFLYEDSPGGTVYHSDELYLKLMEYKEVTGRPIYSYFANQACSGAYYIAMSADKIYANRNCWTGSIGVIISLMNYKELMDKLGVKEIDIVSAENKTIGSATAEMTEEQKEIMQSLVDESFDQFVDIVKTGRNLSESKVRELADGRIYTAKQALNLGLVDEISGFSDAKESMFNELNCSSIYVPKTGTGSFFEIINTFSSNLKKGSDSDIRALADMMENDESGVLMYYAK